MKKREVKTKNRGEEKRREENRIAREVKRSKVKKKEVKIKNRGEE